MSYDEPRFLARQVQGGIQVLVATSTFTASDHVLTATPGVRQAVIRSCVVTGARAVVLTAGVSKVPSVTVSNSVGAAAVFAISHTAAAVSAAPTITTRTFTAGELPAVTIIHTGTASATQITPVLELALEFSEQFS